jgi:hypothetical protein
MAIGQAGCSKASRADEHCRGTALHRRIARVERVDRACSGLPSFPQPHASIFSLKFDAEFREGAVRIVRETGTSVPAVARDLGIV